MSADLTQFNPFRTLGQGDLDTAESYFCHGEFSAGQILFSQGDLADTLYLVVSGELKVSYKPYDTPEITVSRLREGDVAGWSAVLGNKNYTATVSCITNASLLHISGENLRKLVSEHPQTGKMVLDQLAKAATPRWKNAQNQVRSMLNKGMEKSSQ